MPLSADNPNRDRNFLVLILSGTVLFAIIMAGYIILAVRQADTDAYIRFLTILVVSLVPGALSTWQAFKANRTTHTLRTEIHDGVLQDKVKEGVKEVLTGDVAKVTYSGGTTTLPSQSSIEQEESNG